MAVKIPPPPRPSRLCGSHKIQKFVDLLIRKTGLNLTWYFHANSAFLFYRYAITFVLSSRAVGNTTTVLPIWAFQKACIENILFVYLPKMMFFTINFVNTEKFSLFRSFSVQDCSIENFTVISKNIAKNLNNFSPLHN